ncbi:hypothetical protein FACS1894170_02920 [Planctomycetales bacterium]|nr:hypothetical protein FACS1894170_02920 [Planctomycetales bacterium]
MNEKLTRRTVLGTVIGGLAVAPFATWALRRPKQLELGHDSYLKKFREVYQTALDFPRTFDPFSGDNIIPGREREGFLDVMLPRFRTLSTEQQEKALTIQKRFWSNYSKLDEAEFDYTYFGFNKDGTKMQGNFYMSAHVKLKYGYGVEVKGQNVSGEPLHWVFNMDGDATLPAAQEMNLSSMFRDFFDLNKALPEMVVFFGKVTEDVDLPKNPYLTGQGKYDRVDISESKNYPPPQLKEELYNRTYYSRTTGMPELNIHTAIPWEQLTEYLAGKIPLPEVSISYTTYRYVPIGKVFVLTDRTSRRCEQDGGKPIHIATHSNVKIKLL